MKNIQTILLYPIFLKLWWRSDRNLSEEDKKQEKKQLKTERKHEQINEATALWTQAKVKLKQEDYNNFYKSISQDSSDPTIHTKTEG